MFLRACFEREREGERERGWNEKIQRAFLIRPRQIVLIRLENKKGALDA